MKKMLVIDAPESCILCRISALDDEDMHLHCAALGRSAICPDRGYSIPDWCPLVDLQNIEPLRVVAKAAQALLNLRKRYEMGDMTLAERGGGCSTGSGRTLGGS